MVLDRDACKVRKINEVPNAIVMLLQTQRQHLRSWHSIASKSCFQQKKLPVREILEL